MVATCESSVMSQQLRSAPPHRWQRFRRDWPGTRKGARLNPLKTVEGNVLAGGRAYGLTGGPRSASSISVPPEREKTLELMRSRER